MGAGKGAFGWGSKFLALLGKSNTLRTALSCTAKKTSSSLIISQPFPVRLNLSRNPSTPLSEMWKEKDLLRTNSGQVQSDAEDKRAQCHNYVYGLSFEKDQIYHCLSHVLVKCQFFTESKQNITLLFADWEGCIVFFFSSYLWIKFPCQDKALMCAPLDFKKIIKNYVELLLPLSKLNKNRHLPWQHLWSSANGLVFRFSLVLSHLPWYHCS